MKLGLYILYLLYLFHVDTVSTHKGAYGTIPGERTDYLKIYFAEDWNLPVPKSQAEEIA